MAQMVENLPAMQETQVSFLGLEYRLEEDNGHFLRLGTQAGLGHRGVGGVISLGPLLDIQGKHPRASSAKTRGFHTQLDEGPVHLFHWGLPWWLRW